MAPTQFTDLNADVLLHVAALLAPAPSTLGEHWLNGARPTPSSADLRALRVTCRHTREALPACGLDVRLKDGPMVQNEMARWAEAPAEVLGRVR